MKTYKFTSTNNKERHVAVCCNEVVDIKSEEHLLRLQSLEEMYQWSQAELIKHKDTPADSILLPRWIRDIREGKNSTHINKGQNAIAPHGGD